MRRIVLALAALALGSTALTACGGDGGGSDNLVDKAKNDKKLTVGVKIDQPGMGVKKPDGTMEGFDVDVARYIAEKLGVPESGITWKETVSANREPFIQQGQVDFVVATYSILEERKQKVTFGGPYIVAHQDIMVRSNETAVTKVEDLKDKRICQASGSNSYKRITDPAPDGQGIKAKLVPAGNYSECVAKLKGNTLDAVTTDDLILAGFAAQSPSDYKILGTPFTDEKYGVGLKKGDTAGCEAVNDAITEMYKDGTAAKLLDKWFGKTQGLQLPTEAPAFEGCA